MKKILYGVILLVFLFSSQAFSQQYVTVSGAITPYTCNGDYYKQSSQLNGKDWYAKGTQYVLMWENIYGSWIVADYANRNNTQMVADNCYFYNYNNILAPPTNSWSPSFGDGDLTVSSVLPVELKSFTASVLDLQVKLTWQTATELNNYGFDVERTLDGKNNWTKVGFVQGHGNSNSPREYSFTDDQPLSGMVQYRLKQVDNNGQFKYYDAVNVNVNAPKEYKLLQNSPNPFNPSTAIKFQLPANSVVKIKVFDMTGKEVATLVNEERPAGSHIVYWNGKDNNGQSVSSGIYFYSLSTGTHFETRKMNLLK